VLRRIFQLWRSKKPAPNPPALSRISTTEFVLNKIDVFMKSAPKYLSWLITLAVCSIGIVAGANADLIVNYDFTGNAGTETNEATASSNPNITPSSLVRGSGLTASGLADAFNSSGWSTGGLDTSDYYQFSITTNANTTTDLTTLFFRERRTSTGIRNFLLRTSTDNFTSFANQGLQINVPDNAAPRDQAITLSGLTSLSGGTTITFRLYGYTADSASGTWALLNHSVQGGLYLDGSITAIPEPAALLLVGSLVSLVVMKRRRSTKARV
jgi:hypothetical protein